MSRRITVLTGGVGGAKLVDGLYRLLPPKSLTAIVNTGDDFRHFGLPISPDIDTLLYTLSGKSDQVKGWGRAGESWSFMTALRELGGEDWFNLGDSDLATHILRGSMLGSGMTLSEVTQIFADRLGLHLSVLPMSDAPVATWVESEEGPLPFQCYFVEQQCAPIVKAIRFEGADVAMPGPNVIPAIRDAEVIFIAPSNPWLSVDPILSLPAIRQALHETAAPVVAISSLVKGTAVKGPTAKIMQELGLEISNATIAAHYEDFIDAMIVHEGDATPDSLLIAQTDILMKNEADRIRVAQIALDFAASLSK